MSFQKPLFLRLQQEVAGALVPQHPLQMHTTGMAGCVRRGQHAVEGLTVAVQLVKWRRQ